MVKARDWLVERNLAKAGARGRFSREATAALEKAVADGTVFSDYSGVKVAQKVTQRRTKATASKPKAKPADVVLESDPIYSANAKFYAFVDGKRKFASAKSACMHSGYSVAYCPCVMAGISPKHKVIVDNAGYADVEVEGV